MVTGTTTTTTTNGNGNENALCIHHRSGLLKHKRVLKKGNY